MSIFINYSDIFKIYDVQKKAFIIE